MRIEVTVCNVCKDPARQPTAGYRVERHDGRSGEVDLCAQHAEPLEALLPPWPQGAATRKAAKKVAAKKAGTGGRLRKTKMMTMEEIERAKAAQKS